MTEQAPQQGINPDFKPTSLFISEAEFRQEFIYFIIVDRFHDGTADEEEREGVWDRGERPGLLDKTWMEWGKYWGGNLQGIIDQVDYLKSLGVTAVWLSPLFEQVDDMQFDRAPMHGYWTRDFKRINPRFLRRDDSSSLKTSETLRDLVRALHNAGIKLILDVVCNHSSPDINGSKGVVYDDGKPLADFYNDHNNFYYHHPEITDWEDEFQLIHNEMCGLATFNEKNIDFRNYIKSAIKDWIDVGIDALRVDTLKHMPIWFWQEFCTDIKRHKPDVFLFGEYGFSKPWDQRSVRYANDCGMSILDFGLCDGIRHALSGEEPGGFHLIEDVLALDEVYRRANELVTFIDNHDMPRFLSVVDDERKLHMALVLLMSLRGIPCLFYGTEQGLHNNTAGGQDPYNRPMMDTWNQQTELFQLVQKLVALRRNNHALTMGCHQQRFLSDNLYAFSRHYRDFHALVIVNQGNTTSVSIPQTGLPDGRYPCEISGDVVSVVDGGIQSLTMLDRSAKLLSLPGHAVRGTVVAVIQLNGFRTQPGQRLAITGSCSELGAWDHSKSYGMEYVNANTWIAEVPIEQSIGLPIHYKFIVFQAEHAPILENIVSRWFVMPHQGRVKIDCEWNND